MKQRIQVLTFLMLIFMGTVFNTTAQDVTPPPEDATPLDISQTADGITVTLDWVHADSETITIGYTVTPPKTSPDDFWQQIDFVLSLDDGTLLNPYHRRFQLEGSHIWRTWQVIDSDQGQIYEMAIHFTDPPETVDLTLTFTRTPPELRGQNTPSTAPEITAEPVPPAVATAASTVTTITFEFTAPVIQPHVIEVNQTQEIDGTAVTLTKAFVNPRSILFELCHNLTDEWQFERVLVTYSSGNNLALPFFEQVDGCKLHQTGGARGTVRLNVLSLFTGYYHYPLTLEDWRILEPYMNEDGIYLDLVIDDALEGGFRLAGYLDAEGVPYPYRAIDGKIDRYLEEAGLINRIRGNWEFSFDVPGGIVTDVVDVDNIYELTEDGELRITEKYTAVTPVPEDIFNYNVAYLVNPDALSPDLPAHQPDMLSKVTGAQVFTSWADFATTTDVATTDVTNWDALIIHENIFETVDTAWTAQQRTSGLIITGINLTREQMNAAAGESREIPADNPLAEAEAFYTIYGDQRVSEGLLEAVGDLSALQVQLMVAVTRGFFG